MKNFNNLKKFLILFGVFSLLFLFLNYNLNSGQTQDIYESIYYNDSRINEKIEIIKNKCNYGPNGPRILCAVFTHVSSHKTKLLAVHKTWAKR